MSLQPWSNGHAGITEPEPADPPEPQPHMARATRIFRRGAWTPAAVCWCGWTEYAHNHADAQERAVKHEAKP